MSGGGAGAGGAAGIGTVQATIDGTVVRFWVTRAAYAPGSRGSLVEAVNVQPDGSMAHGLSFNFPGDMSGTFPCSAMIPTQLFNYSYDTAHWGAGFGQGACNIVVTGYGPVGQSITGTFTATLPPKVNTMATVMVTDGSFEATRQPDITMP